MSVTLTDEKHAELVRMLDTIIRGCDARAYDIGLSLDPLRELLGDVAALTREPAPADADAGTGNSSKGTVPHAPRCAVNTEPGDTALTEEECCTCGAMRPAPDVIDALNQPMISDHNIVATHRVVEPAPCPHRELMEELVDAEQIFQSLPIGTAQRTMEAQGERVSRAFDRARESLAQPCAAPGEAGEWSEAGLVTHKFKAHYDVAGSCTEPLSNIAQDGDYIRVYEPRYRRRAPGGGGR